GRQLAPARDRRPVGACRTVGLPHRRALREEARQAEAVGMIGVRRLPATTVFYGLELLDRVPTWVVMSVYLVRELHLSPLQLVLMGTAMEASVFLFEIPTGVVA